MDEIETPNSKDQITNKSDPSNSKYQTNFLVIRDWSLKFMWRLGFGIMNFEMSGSER